MTRGAVTAVSRLTLGSRPRSGRRAERSLEACGESAPAPADRQWEVSGTTMETKIDAPRRLRALPSGTRGILTEGHLLW